MRPRHLLPAALAVATSVLTAAPAAARPDACGAGLRLASIAAKAGRVLDHSAQHPAGVPLKAGARLRFGHVYELVGTRGVVTGRATTYRLSNGAMIGRDCHDGHFAAIDLIVGKAGVQTSGQAGVITHEAFMAPLDARAMRYSVSRRTRVKGRLTPLAMSLTLAGSLRAPFGTTRTHYGAGPAGFVNVTPYVGPREGDCRHAHAATLTSTGVVYGPVKGYKGKHLHLGGRARYKLAR